MAKRNSGHRLGKCIKITTTSLEMALEQLELRKQVQPRHSAQRDSMGLSVRLNGPRCTQEEASRPASARDGSVIQTEQEDGEEDERDLYCVCQQPYNVDTAMISCDDCEEWYHCRCIGISQTTARSIKKYVCPLCLALRGNGRELEQALSRTRRTRSVALLLLVVSWCGRGLCRQRRVRLRSIAPYRCRRATAEALREAVAEAGSLPCVMPEAESLAHTLSLFKRWHRAAADLLRDNDLGIAAANRAAQRQPAPEAGSSPAQPDAAPVSALPAGTNGEDEIDLGSLEALDAILSEDIAADLQAARAQREAQESTAQPSAEWTEEAPSAAGEPRVLGVKTLSQLVKSALSIEITVGGLQDQLLKALQKQRWRQKAEAALKPNTKCTGSYTSGTP